MTVTATVTRTELSLAALDINDGATYRLLSDPFDAGAVSWRRQLARSPYVDGAVEVGAVKELARGQAQILVKAATAGALQTSVDTLLDAFTQSSYTLTVTIDGTAWAWTCQRADYGVAFSAAESRTTRTTVNLTFPRSPVPSAGPY